MFLVSKGPNRVNAAIAGVVLCASLIGVAGAQVPAAGDTVVVTATRSPLPLSQVLADMSVLGMPFRERQLSHP